VNVGHSYGLETLCIAARCPTRHGFQRRAVEAVVLKRGGRRTAMGEIRAFGHKLGPHPVEPNSFRFHIRKKQLYHSREHTQEMFLPPNIMV